MELENATIIDFGDVELLANKEDLYMGYDNEAKFKINWCRLKDKPDELIRLNVEYDKLSKEIKEKNIPIIDIGKIIEKQYKDWDKKYHNLEIIDINKYLTLNDKKILERLGIKVKDKIYTEYEYECLRMIFLTYYDDPEDDLSEEELKYQKIYLNKDFNLHKVEVYGNDIVKIKFQVEDLDLKAGLSTDLFDLKKYVQVEETDCKDEECTEKQTMGSIETAIYPLYMPSETYLSSSETVNTDDNSRIILTYSGGKNFVLVEEGAIKSQEHEIIPVYGEPVILNDTIAALSTNSIYWTSNNIDYYMASEDLSLKEMISIASSMNNSKNVVSLK